MPRRECFYDRWIPAFARSLEHRDEPHSRRCIACCTASKSNTQTGPAQPVRRVKHKSFESRRLPGGAPSPVAPGILHAPCMLSCRFSLLLPSCNRAAVIRRGYRCGRARAAAVSSTMAAAPANGAVAASELGAAGARRSSHKGLHVPSSLCNFTGGCKMGEASGTKCTRARCAGPPRTKPPISAAAAAAQLAQAPQRRPMPQSQSGTQRCSR